MGKARVLRRTGQPQGQPLWTHWDQLNHSGLGSWERTTPWEGESLSLRSSHVVESIPVQTIVSPGETRCFLWDKSESQLFLEAGCFLALSPQFSPISNSLFLCLRLRALWLTCFGEFLLLLQTPQLMILWFWPIETDFRFLISRTLREQIGCVLSYQVYGNCLQQPKWWRQAGWNGKVDVQKVSCFIQDVLMCDYSVFGRNSIFNFYDRVSTWNKGKKNPRKY